MGLFSILFGKNNAKNQASIKVDADTSFYINHHDYIKKLDSGMTTYIQLATSQNTVDSEITHLKDFIRFFDAKKKEAEGLGGQYEKYFHDTYEHCHNSREKDFSLITYYKERFEYLNKNFETERSKEQKLKTLSKDILIKLKENEGILQKDFCKLFDSNITEEVRSELYFLSKNGKIIREKKGNTYILNSKA